MTSVPAAGPLTEHKSQEVHLLSDRQALMRSLKKLALPETREELVAIVEAAAKKSGKQFPVKDINWIVTQLWTSATTKKLFPPKN